MLHLAIQQLHIGSPVVAICLVFGLGIAAQWLAWKPKFPSIVLLLVFGLLAGAGASAVWEGRKLLDPDGTFGDLVMPIVSLSVAIILFEGGLSLRLGELREHGRVVRNLCSIGALATWLLTTLALYGLGLLNVQLSLLLGAILVVTGPTVIGPLLRQVRVQGPVGPVLKWEGIVIDPIGASLAVLVYEAILAGSLQEGTAGAAWAFLRTVLVGGTLGVATGYALTIVVRRHWVPEFLENGISLAMVLTAYTASNFLQAESGLLAVTIMGILVGNVLSEAHVKHIIEFKENLRTLIISSLFIVLGARLDAKELLLLDWGRVFLFLLWLIVVARPVCVWLSTLGSKLRKRERLFLAAMAPRGIVAAAVTAVFALRLEDAGQAEAALLTPLAFTVIICTVAFYGLISTPLAQRLRLADPSPQGLMILGAHSWARSMALALKKEGIRVLLIDNNYSRTTEARLAGLEAHHANVLSDYVVEELDLGGIGRLLAMTSNDEVNSLAAERFATIFGASALYQIPPRAEGKKRHDATHHHRVRYAFGRDLTFWLLQERVEGGHVVKTNRLTEEFTFERWRALYGLDGVPLFLITKAGRLQVFTTDTRLTPAPGDTLISLLRPRANGTTSQRAAKQADTEPELAPIEAGVREGEEAAPADEGEAGVEGGGEVEQAPS